MEERYKDTIRRKSPKEEKARAEDLTIKLLESPYNRLA